MAQLVQSQRQSKKVILFYLIVRFELFNYPNDIEFSTNIASFFQIHIKEQIRVATVPDRKKEIFTTIAHFRLSENINGEKCCKSFVIFQRQFTFSIEGALKIPPPVRHFLGTRQFDDNTIFDFHWPMSRNHRFCHLAHNAKRKNKFNLRFNYIIELFLTP